jgi:hypothetical protein
MLVHRGLLHRLSDSQGRQRTGIWLMLASIATGVLALLACTLGFLVVFMSGQAHLLQRPVTWIVGYVESVIKDATGGLGALQEAVRLQPVMLPGMAFPSFGIWLYAPCFPFLWVWLYLLAGVCIRGATALGCRRTPGDTPGLLDLDARPLHTLGVVAVAMVSVLYWTALLWRR